MKYYVGEWNGHKIVATNKLETEQLIIDGEVVDETKHGLRLGSAFDVELKDGSGMHCYVILGGSATLTTPACHCIIGKPVELEYDKPTKTYRGEFEGKKVSIIRKGRHSFCIDGEEVRKSKSIICCYSMLGSDPDANGKRFFAILDGLSGSGTSVRVSAYADAVAVKLTLCNEKNGEYIPDKKGLEFECIERVEF